MLKLPVLEVRSSLNESVDADVVMVFQDVSKKAIPPKGIYYSLLERLRKGSSFLAAQSTALFVRFGGKGKSESVLFSGLGQVAELTEEKARSSGGQAWSRLVSEKIKTVSIHVDSFAEGKSVKSELTPLKLARAFAEGMILGAYSFNKYKTKKKIQTGKGADYQGPSRIIFLTQNVSLKKKLENELLQVRAIGVSVNLTRDWSNEPSNVGTPEYYAAQARNLAREYGLKCRILTEKDAAREKMGLFLGVGQGAEREGRIVIVEYNPKGVRKPKTIALVGKGVTFDSGGISIKPSLHMEGMKHDMTGAATVMGATVLAALWKVPNRIVTIMAFTENMPDGNAIQPGNILVARNKKTVEIINTDAEGRLILADVLDYAQDFKPDVVVDAATLTGAVSVALGKQCCGIMGNDESLIDSIRRAGEKEGERIWQLPLYDEYFDDMKSDFADMRNSANDSQGGTIRGAIFLKQFIRKGVRWAHLDIAATSTNLGHLLYYPKKGASGSYVRSLARFAAEF